MNASQISSKGLEDIKNKIESGAIKLRDLENHCDAEVAAELRRGEVEKDSGENLANLGGSRLDAEKLKNKNIENFVGTVEIPVGVAGPVDLVREGSADRASSKSANYVPIATTEGALVASLARGIKAVNKSGGARVYTKDVGMTRAPLFSCRSIAQALEVEKWVAENFKELKEVAEATSSHLQLQAIDSYRIGRDLWLRIICTTDRAMGMNMVSKASQVIVDRVLAADFPGLEMVALSGNLCTDKKPSLLNVIEGRGVKASAEVVLPESVVEKILKTTGADIAEVNLKKVWRASALQGTTAHNAHVGNIVAGIFAATGQDLAHVTDASQAQVVMEYSEGELYASIDIPALAIATIGGGTGLPAQNQALQLLLGGATSKLVLAEVIAAAALAGELSLHAALANGKLVCAHQELGKGR